MTVKLCLVQEPEADALLGANPFALLIGMLLDQQVPMETAFAGRIGQCLHPAVIAIMAAIERRLVDPLALGRLGQRARPAPPP